MLLLICFEFGSWNAFDLLEYLYQPVPGRGIQKNGSLSMHGMYFFQDPAGLMHEALIRCCSTGTASSASDVWLFLCSQMTWRMCCSPTLITTAPLTTISVQTCSMSDLTHRHSNRSLPSRSAPAELLPHKSSRPVTPQHSNHTSTRPCVHPGLGLLTPHLPLQGLATSSA